MCEFVLRSYRYSSLVSLAWYGFVLFKPFSRFTALADLHSRAWDDIQSSARQNKVVCLSESPESGRWKKGIAKVLSQQIYSGISTVDYEGMYFVHEIFLFLWEQKARFVTIIYRLVPKRLPTIELIWSWPFEGQKLGRKNMLEQNGQAIAPYCCCKFFGNR